jgi:hypothetical protein
MNTFSQEPLLLLAFNSCSAMLISGADLYTLIRAILNPYTRSPRRA